MKRKIALTALLILLALMLVAAGTLRYWVVKEGKSVDAFMGRAGVHFEKSQLSGILKLSRPGETNYSMGFTQKLVDARFTDSKGNKVTKVKGAVYVHFKIRQKEFKLWDAGLLTIWYFDPWFNEWKECPTFEVFNGGTTTLACRIDNFGRYGLGLR